MKIVQKINMTFFCLQKNLHTCRLIYNNKFVREAISRYRNIVFQEVSEYVSEGSIRL